MSLIDPPVKLPAPDQAYLAKSSGAVTFSGTTLTLPSCQWVYGTKVRDIAQQNFTVPTPSRTCATIAAGVPTLSLNPQQLALLNVAVTNTSGGSVTGTFDIIGVDERGILASDTISISGLANGNSTNIQSNKYFGGITAINNFTGNANASGVSMTITEKQFRGHLKVDSTAVAGFAWNNTYVSGDVKLCTFEVISTGVKSVQDWRIVGPTPKGLRTEIVDFCGATAEGPQSWNGQCIYAACEGLDGHLFIGGNGALMSEFDGQKFGTAWTPTGLGGTDHISALYNMGLIPISGVFKEIIYIATLTGKFVRWNRTDNTYSTVSTAWNTSYQVSKLVKGTSNNKFWAIGGNGQVFEITENGSSQSSVSYQSNVGFNGAATIYDGVWFDGHLYVGGGGGVWMEFHRFNQESNKAIDLSQYLPGTTAQQGRSLSALVPKVFGMAVNPAGKILLAAQGNGGYIAEWDTRQQFATGKLTFTTSGAATIPAGTQVTDGTNTYRTLEACSTSGAGTVIVPAIAALPGDAGLALPSTVTTLVSPPANVTAVTNTWPFGMGRLIAPPGNEDIPQGLTSNLPLGLFWSGTRWIIPMQAGDVLSFDGQRLSNITNLFSFKGRATFGFRTHRKAWIGGDEGKLYAIPA